MSDSLEILRRKIDGATDVSAVVSAMKAVAASSISQYEMAVAALTDYNRTVELGLSLTFNENKEWAAKSEQSGLPHEIGVIVFGSDQGLVGQFNDQLAEFVVTTLSTLQGTQKIWAVGDRMNDALTGRNLSVVGGFDLPLTITEIVPLISSMFTMIEPQLPNWLNGGLYVMHNQPDVGMVYRPVSRILLPLGKEWLNQSASLKWPGKNLPEIIGEIEPALVREYLFISIFKACAESLASENASRLAAMQRAEKNVADLLKKLTQTYHRLRQSSIDEELFDILSGFNGLPGKKM